MCVAGLRSNRHVQDKAQWRPRWRQKNQKTASKPPIHERAKQREEGREIERSRGERERERENGRVINEKRRHSPHPVNRHLPLGPKRARCVSGVAHPR